MKPTRFFFTRFWIEGMAMVALFAASAAAQIVIVVPAQSRLDSLTTPTLQKIFKGEAIATRQEIPLQIVEYEPASDAFYQQLYHADAYAMGKHWLRLIFSGARVVPPKSFSDLAKFLRFLKAHDNAIGFLPAAAFAAAKNDSLRAVVIEGWNYYQPQYPFRQTPAR